MNSDNNAAVLGAKVNELYPASRVVNIKIKESTSAYLSKNLKWMPDTKRRIGASIRAVDRMKLTMPEWLKYMPSIIGESANSPEFAKSFDKYLNNVSKIVPEGGLKLEVGYTFNSKSDYDLYVKSNEVIQDTFNRADKSDPDKRKLAFKLRDESIIALEAKQYKVATPLNVANYFLWRYAMVYGDCANDIALINTSGAIRLYIDDPAVEAHKRNVLFKAKKAATIAYVKCLEDVTLIKRILWTYLEGVVNINQMDENDMVSRLETFKDADPNKFLKFVNDKDIAIKATIEMMIHFNVLRRLENSSVIVDEHNDVVGSTTADAIAFFKNAEPNKARITAFRAKLKAYTNG